MERGRMKTVVLTLLVCINLLLGGNLIYTNTRRYHIPAKAKAEITEYLARQGISLSNRALPGRNKTLSLIAYPGDENRQAAMVEKLLGAAKKEEQGGGLSAYESPKGTALFRRGGVLEITLPGENDGNWDAAAAEKAAKTLLSSAGISMPGGAVAFGRQGGGVFVRFRPKQSGLEVENAELEVFFAPTETIVAGKLLAGKPEETKMQTRSLVSLLADFAGISALYELDIERIINVIYVYYHTVDEAGKSLLVPACRIETENKAFLLNAVDGTLLESR